MLFQLFNKKKKSDESERLSADLKQRLSEHQRTQYTDDPAFREVTGSGFDNFLNDVQSILLDEAKKQFEIYCAKIDAYYQSPESRAGAHNCPNEFSAQYSSAILARVQEYLNSTYPDFFKAIEKSEKYIGKFSENGHPHGIFATFLWIIGPENFKELKDLERTMFDGVGSFSVWKARKEALNRHWKSIIIVDGPVHLDECANYLCYDPELKFLFSLSPNDNYRHWTDYVYAFVSEPEEDFPEEFELSNEVPARYKSPSMYFSESLPELAGRTFRHLSQL